MPTSKHVDFRFDAVLVDFPGKRKDVQRIVDERFVADVQRSDIERTHFGLELQAISPGSCRDFLRSHRASKLR